MKFKNGVGHPDKLIGYSDNYYTSAEQVKDCVERVTLNKNWKILCPFDTDESEFVKYFKLNGYNVTYLKEGELNTNYNPENFDIIVTNPPWKNFFKLYSNYFDRCPRFIAILSWTLIFNAEKNKTSPRKLLKNYLADKYRSTHSRINFNATNSDKKIGCIYLYKGFTTGINIQPVKPLKID